MDARGTGGQDRAGSDAALGRREFERGTGGGEEEGLKTCPRCGARLFADMDVCYGCLYDFSKGSSGRDGRPDGGGSAGTRPEAPASGGAGRQVGGTVSGISATGAAFGGGPVGSAPGEVGEARDAKRPPTWPEPCCGEEAPDELWGSLDELWDGEAAESGPPWPGGVPGGSDCGSSVGDEASREEASMTSRLCAIGASEGGACVRVFAAGLALTCAVPPSGLTIGRDSDNDLTLLSRSVSRRHVRLVPCEGGIIVQDLGATNPALLNGRMLVDGRRMWVGDTLEIRGSGVTIRTCPTR